MAALFVCIFLIVFYSLTTADKPVIQDVAPHEWRITRQMWLAQDYNLFTAFAKEFSPLKLISIQNTVGRECHTFIECAAEVRNVQRSFLIDHGYDIPYNFLIGNDGRVYEGRGWNRVGAHTLSYNSCSVGIGFMGDYREEMPVYSKVTDLQMKNFMRIIEEGIREGHLTADYYVFGAKDVGNTCSPGSNLYKVIQKLDHYDHAKQFRNKNCSVIYGHM